jgi:mono/diheme cytochrome c family protein
MSKFVRKLESAENFLVMKLTQWRSCCWLFAALLTASSALGDEADSNVEGAARFPHNVNQFFSTYCMSCHGSPESEGGVKLDTFNQDLIHGPHAEDWHEVLDALNKGEMPPEEAEQPSKAERNEVIAFLTGAFKKAAEARRSTGGQVVMRRLTNYEYNNTLNDLLSLNENWSKDFPPDSISEDGFRNNGQYMGISALQMENYIEAATQALDEAIYPGDQPELKTIDLKDVKELYTREGKKAHLAETSYAATLYWKDHPKQGPVVVEITLSGVKDPDRIDRIQFLQAGSRLSVKKGNRDAYAAKQVDVDPEISIEGNLVHLRYRIPKIELYPQVLPNHPFEEYALNFNGRNRDVRVESMKAKGPYYETWPPKSHRQIFIPSKNEENESIYARDILESFMTRAWRRPVENHEVEELYDDYQAYRKDASFEKAIRDSLVQVLVSPEFLYLVEQKDPSGERENLSTHELASRLSYFLWSSMPDEKLFRLASSGDLAKADVLRAEVDRMLRDERSWRFAEQFSSQWLGLNRMNTIAVSPEIYPDFDDALIEDMKQETQHFFGHVLHENLSALNFIDSDFTFLSERLERHYGGPRFRAGSPAFRKVDLQEGSLDDNGKRKGISHRGGILTHASIHLANSDGEDSHAVNRGVWLVDKILGNPPPEPPADVALDQTIEGFDKLSLKQQLAAHVQKESCANCHVKIDPFGVAFENYDAVGTFRTKVRKLDQEELAKRLEGAKREDPEVVFKKIDTSGDGFLQKDEWITHVNKDHMGQPLDPKNLEEQFNSVAAVRADKRGMNSSHPHYTISPDEYRRHVTKLEREATKRVQDNLPYQYVSADAKTVLPDSTKISGLDDLKAYLLENKKDEFAENMVRRLLTYALGRSLEFSDEQTVQTLTKQFQENDYKLASLVEEIVLCDLFQTK